MGTGGPAVTIHSKAPLRLDFAGGWSDVAAFADEEGGTVVTAAIQLAVHIEFLLGDRRIRLHSADGDEHVTVESAGQMVYDGRLDFHKAALNMLPVTGGIEIISRSDAPPGSGLGSGALAVALLAGLARCRQEDYDPTELAELGFTLETSELGGFGWPQDHQVAAHGGFLVLGFEQGGVDVRALAVTDEAARDLARHAVLAYVGRSFFTARTHARVSSACESRDPSVVGAIRAMRDVAREAGKVIEAGDWRQLAALTDENWRHQRLLDATMVTPETMRIDEAVHAAGAWGLKATGVGAGGCLIVLCSPSRRSAVAEAVESCGGRVLQCHFAAEGVSVWLEADAPDPT
ncbi:MAG: hypothetical protein JSW71_01700 [Gemmatimonadota bacterium]|nr:MAG: hypothetical protein JSW71_01700 [Gemmatimonadota bacterium]